eukprot:1143624-Pelagomonas_calceolata.AAC.1
MKHVIKRGTQLYVYRQCSKVSHKKPCQAARPGKKPKTEGNDKAVRKNIIALSVRESRSESNNKMTKVAMRSTSKPHKVEVYNSRKSIYLHQQVFAEVPYDSILAP